MAEPVAKRKVYVQAMRKAARACGVELILDTAGRARVVEFAQLIEASSGPLARKQVPRLCAHSFFANVFVAPVPCLGRGLENSPWRDERSTNFAA